MVEISTYTEKYNDFARQLLWKYYEENNDQNIVMSPFSVLTLLVIAADATAGETRNEVLKALSEDLENDDIISLICKIQSVLTEGHALSSANAVCVQHSIWYIGAALILGFVAYGLSIFLYVRAQNVLGAAKTSAYYAVAPFVGAFLSFVVLREQLSWMYFIALIVMLGGSALVVADTLIRHHIHEHQHTFTHTHDGTTHTHTITHSHNHNHYVTDGRHGHYHTSRELELLSGALHR